MTGFIPIADQGGKQVHSFSACRGDCDHSGGNPRLGPTVTAPRQSKSLTVAQPYKSLILWVGQAKNPDAKRLWRSARGTAWAACSATGQGAASSGWRLQIVVRPRAQRGSGIAFNRTRAVRRLTGIWDLVREIVHHHTCRVAIPRNGRVEPVPAGPLARLRRRCGLGWTASGVRRQ